MGLPAAPEGAISFLLGGRDGRLLLLALFAVLGLPVVALSAVVATSWLSLTVRVIVVRLRARHAAVHAQRR